jgi:hypothetical protein
MWEASTAALRRAFIIKIASAWLVVRFHDRERMAGDLVETMEAESMLIGRVTCESFAGAVQRLKASSAARSWWPAAARWCTH